MEDRHVTIPLMVRNEEIQFVEEDYDTISENEQSTDIPCNPSREIELNIYTEISCNNSKVDFLDVPKLNNSRSESSGAESSGAGSPMLERKFSSHRKSNHDYEKLSVTSNSSKKSAVERIADSKIFRRRTDNAYDRKSESKSDDEESALEVLRQVVRKCTTIDPVKRPSSKDVLELMATSNEKS